MVQIFFIGIGLYLWFKKTSITVSDTRELRGNKKRNAAIVLIVIGLLMFIPVPDGYELVGIAPPVLAVASIFMFVEKKEVSMVPPATQTL